jgi:glutathione S-transferase
MVLKIHHVPLARSTRPIWLYYELLELYESGKLPELEIVYVDMNKFRTDKSPDFLAKNPNGKVPLLVFKIFKIGNNMLIIQ